MGSVRILMIKTVLYFPPHLALLLVKVASNSIQSFDTTLCQIEKQPKRCACLSVSGRARRVLLSISATRMSPTEFCNYNGGTRLSVRRDYMRNYYQLNY